MPDPTSSHDSSDENTTQDDDLRKLVEEWPTLPGPVRAGIVAMVKAAVMSD